ncbi:hypothetical protein A0H81_07114 [Grifola frondosa]|uniref:Uncharacterized protein n=1 Tax=Grifola frondosa TaxID=5627 RepID=A0A1C7M972_GRIFR|nr:hypothetical protein A0H81_07114 [Grifola frondosa]
MTAKEAISALRAIRPVETEQQEAFVSKYYSTIWKRQSVVRVLAPEPPPCPLIIEGTLTTDSDLFILVGLPGSGKSYFSRALLARNPRSWTHISQDDMGSRSACETAIGNGCLHGRILLDRCNASLDDCKEWLRLSVHWASAPVCVWFDYEREVCASRAQNRAAHPALPPGNRVRNAIEQMQKTFVRPSLTEGF